MTTKNGDMPAMPTIYGDMAPNGQREIYCSDVGLTKREMMAMHMMAHLMPDQGFKSYEDQSKCAVAAADILLAELERTK